MSASPAEAGRRGSAFLSRGFRPFFLGAGVWAVVGIALWPAVFSGSIEIPTAFSGIDWHAHEMIFGYGGAVVAGFLLTAIPNWTGRLPVAGTPLAALAAFWGAGRLAVFGSAVIGRGAAAVIDAGFFVAFLALIAREVIAGKNGRNVKVVALVAALALADVAFHVEDARQSLADTSIRAALGIFVMLILLIGGRVTPSFTGNWIARKNAGPRPVPFGRADAVVMGVSALALIAWVLQPEGAVTGLLSLLAGGGNLWRLSRWQGLAARRDALVLVLHVGFLLAALGFVAAGASALWPAWVPYPVGVHIWAIGAIGVMTLAMMTRATLGHTGHALVASKTTVVSYALVIVALLARIAMAYSSGDPTPLMHLAATAWVLGFVGFLIVYAPMLATDRAG